MRIRCVVAALDSSGVPSFASCRVECTEEDYAEGKHYEAAEALAQELGYEPQLVYDERDGPQWLFEHFQAIAGSRAVCHIETARAHNSNLLAVPGGEGRSSK